MWYDSGVEGILKNSQFRLLYSPAKLMLHHLPFLSPLGNFIYIHGFKPTLRSAQLRIVFWVQTCKLVIGYPTQLLHRHLKLNTYKSEIITSSLPRPARLSVFLQSEVTPANAPSQVSELRFLLWTYPDIQSVANTCLLKLPLPPG